MLSKHPGQIPTQGEAIARLLASRGHAVVATSDQLAPARRALDTIATMIRRRVEYDTVVVTTYSGRSWVLSEIAAALARALGKRTVVSLHGGGLPELAARQPRRVRRLLAAADAIVCQSGFHERMVGSFGLSATRIPNVLHVGSYGGRRRDGVRPRLMWMRSFHPIYNPQLAIRVLAELRRSYPDASLVMAGPDKGELAACQRLVQELGLAEVVRFPGFLDMAGKQREGNAADIFLNTNRVDNRPLAVVEAAAMGLVVVATDVGGLRDLLADEVNGLLVPDDDVAAMVRAIRRLVEDPALAARLSAAGPLLAQASAPEEVAVAWERLLG